MLISWASDAFTDHSIGACSDSYSKHSIFVHCGWSGSAVLAMPSLSMQQKTITITVMLISASNSLPLELLICCCKAAWGKSAKDSPDQIQTPIKKSD